MTIEIVNSDPTLTAEHLQFIRHAMNQISIHLPQLLPALLRIRVLDARSCTTATVTSIAVDPNGRLFVSGTFIEQLKQAFGTSSQGLAQVKQHLFFYIAHCAVYPLLLHHQRQGSKEKSRWNRSSARAINHMLQQIRDEKGESKVPMPRTPVILPPRGKESFSVEQLYLEEDPSDGSGSDTTRMGDVQLPGDLPGSGAGFVDSPKAEADSGAFSAVWQDAANQIRYQSAMAGHLPGYKAFELLLSPPPPRVPWRRVLTQAVDRTAIYAGVGDVTWNKLNRRAWMRGIYLPGPIGQDRKLAVVIDTSGSMSDDSLKQIISETSAIAKQATASIYLVVHDAEVMWAGWLRKATVGEVASRLSGRGGTLFQPAYDAVEASRHRFDGFVHFTDGGLGDSSWPRKPPLVRGDCVCALTDDRYGCAIPSWMRVVDVEV